MHVALLVLWWRHIKKLGPLCRFDCWFHHVSTDALQQSRCSQKAEMWGHNFDDTPTSTIRKWDWRLEDRILNHSLDRRAANSDPLSLPWLIIFPSSTLSVYISKIYLFCTCAGGEINKQSICSIYLQSGSTWKIQHWYHEVRWSNLDFPSHLSSQRSISWNIS